MIQICAPKDQNISGRQKYFKGMRDQTKTSLIFSLGLIMIASSASFVYFTQPCSFPNICSGHVNTVTLASATLYAGSTSFQSNRGKASFMFTLNNPGAETYISSLSMWQDNQTIYYGNSTSVIATITPENSIQISAWKLRGNQTNEVNFSIHSLVNSISSGMVTSFSFYPDTSTPMNFTKDEVWNYSIQCTNGQSVSGSLIAQ